MCPHFSTQPKPLPGVQQPATLPATRRWLDSKAGPWWTQRTPGRTQKGLNGPSQTKFSRSVYATSCNYIYIQSWDAFRMLSTALLLLAILAKACSGHAQFGVLIVLQQVQALRIPRKYWSQVSNSCSIQLLVFISCPYMYVQDWALELAKLPHQWLKYDLWCCRYNYS